MTALLGFWLWRARALLVGLGLGAVIGGALGNGYDRFAYGAVVDFLDLHAFGRHFFVFNLADAAINLGVALLIFDGLFGVGQADGARSGGGREALTGQRGVPFSVFHARERKFARPHDVASERRNEGSPSNSPDCRLNEWTEFVAPPRFEARGGGKIRGFRPCRL